MPPRSLAVFSQAGLLMVSGVLGGFFLHLLVSDSEPKKNETNKQKGEEEKKRAGFGK